MLALLLSTVTALGLFTVVQATPAAAVTTGCGYSCDNKDPHTYKVWFNHQIPDGYNLCEWDAVTKYSKQVFDPFGNPAYIVQLRYSPYCRTAWAKLYDPGTSCTCLANYWVESYTTATGGSPRLQVTQTSPYGPWSYMVNDAGLYARACLTEYWNDTSQTTVCTSPRY